MTREEAKELLPLIQAFVERKTIEFLNNNGEWEELDDIVFCREPKYYRIKQETKYRPFNTQEECWQEMHKHPDFGWVMKSGAYLKVQSIYADAICTIDDQNGIGYEHALIELTFTDGTPFGVNEEQLWQ